LYNYVYLIKDLNNSYFYVFNSLFVSFIPTRVFTSSVPNTYVV